MQYHLLVLRDRCQGGRHGRPKGHGHGLIEALIVLLESGTGGKVIV